MPSILDIDIKREKRTELFYRFTRLINVLVKARDMAQHTVWEKEFEIIETETEDLENIAEKLEVAWQEIIKS